MTQALIEGKEHPSEIFYDKMSPLNLPVKQSVYEIANE
jgi:hypothetical protein